MKSPFAGLRGTELARAERLAATFRSVGAHHPEEWAASEVREDVPQVARYLLLRDLWRGIDEWRDGADEWVPLAAEDAERAPEAAFADAGAALQRMLDAGVSVEDLGRVARMVAYDVTYAAVIAVDRTFAEDAPEGTPGWVLAETGPDGVATGRIVGGLHESLLETDPSGREGRPE